MRRSSVRSSGHRHARGGEPVGGQHVGEQLLRRQHRRPGVQHADHARTLHFAHSMSPSRNASRSALGPSSPRCCSAPTRPGCRRPLLVRTGALFGISEGTVRTALSRMVAAGEVDAAGRRLRAGRPPRRAPATPDRQPPGRDGAVGRHLGARDDRGRRARRPPPTAPRCATRSGRCAWPSSARGCGAGPTTSTPTRTPDAAAVVDRWCIRWRGARPDAAPDARGAVGRRRVGPAEAGQRRREMDAARRTARGR